MDLAFTLKEMSHQDIMVNIFWHLRKHWYSPMVTGIASKESCVNVGDHQESAENTGLVKMCWICTKVLYQSSPKLNFKRSENVDQNTMEWRLLMQVQNDSCIHSESKYTIQNSSFIVSKCKINLEFNPWTSLCYYRCLSRQFRPRAGNINVWHHYWEEPRAQCSQKCFQKPSRS